jgi:hypothetical protein
VLMINPKPLTLTGFGSNQEFGVSMINPKPQTLNRVRKQSGVWSVNGTVVHGCVLRVPGSLYHYL